MQELEARGCPRQLFKKAPNPEFIPMDVCIMKQHNAPVGEFRQPEIEIMRDGFVGMIAVYVKKVDRPISKSLIRLVKLHPQQFRE
jgi:hypothetical protein